MRIKLDENLPLDLIADLGALGHDVEHVYGEQLSGHPDPEVWRAARCFVVLSDSKIRVRRPE